MTLFSRADDPWSHRTRIVLGEKSIHVETIDVQGGNLPEDLLDLNPYHTVPTLVDRDLVLYDSRVIIDYIADRKQGQRARKILRDSILASTDVFKAKPYFLSDEFSLVDASIAPILWRLTAWEIDLPPQAQVITKYANLVF